MKTVILLASPESAAALPALLAEHSWQIAASRIAVHVGLPAPVEADGPAVPPIYDAVVEISSDAAIDLQIKGALAGWGMVDIRASQKSSAKRQTRSLR